MKINVQKDLLLEKLNLVSRFTSNRLASSTALQGVLIKTDDSHVHLFSTNLTTYFHTSFPYTEKEPIQVIIEPRKIVEFLNLLNPGEVILDLSDKQVIIRQDKTRGSFPVMTAEDFPLPPTMVDNEQNIDSKFFLDNLPLLLFTASSDETRPVLTGINFVNAESELLMVATDGFRLSLIKKKAMGEIPSMIIPSDFLQEILKSIKDIKQIGFSFSREEKLVKFTVGGDEYYSRLIEGEFPPFERVILNESKTKVKVDKADLQRNVKLISIFARDFSNVVIGEFTKEGLTIRPKKEANQENTAFQDIEMEGEDQKIAFNYKFVLDLLNHVDEKTVIMEILRPDAPVAFKLEKNKDFLHIIMPVRIQEE
ncbi:MAG: DNA polymerase III subunit beta [Patescibacteria group bacterium]